jgi:hypothetical protein
MCAFCGEQDATQYSQRNLLTRRIPDLLVQWRKCVIRAQTAQRLLGRVEASRLSGALRHWMAWIAFCPRVRRLYQQTQDRLRRQTLVIFARIVCVKYFIARSCRSTLALALAEWRKTITGLEFIVPRGRKNGGRLVRAGRG